MKKTMLAALLFPVLVSFSQAGSEAHPDCGRVMAVYGDNKAGDAVHKKIAALIKAARPGAVFHVGDLVSKGKNAKAWDNFMEITKDLRSSASFYAVLGNHEAGGEKTFVKLFGFPDNGRWYRVDADGIRFIMLDYLSPLGKGSVQFKWLEKELGSAAGKAKFTVIAMHKPLWSTGAHGHDNWAAAADLEKLFMERGVDMVISGHDHDYERLEKNGLVQLVTGGGAELRPQAFKSPYSRIFAEVNHYCLISVCGNTLKAEVFDINNKLIDGFELPAKKTAGTAAARVPGTTARSHE